MTRTPGRRYQTVLLLAALLLPRAADAAESRPSIVFLMTDDQSTDSLGCYGNPDVRTPHIDRLAAEGVTFDRHYVTTAICMASRASVMTGKYEYRTGCNFTRGPLEERDWRNSYPRRLRDAGYTTAFAGKLGFVMRPTGGGEPNLPAPDFDAWGGGPGQTSYETRRNESIARYADRYPHSTRAYGAFGADFIREAAGKGRPFCLSISFKAPHKPDQPDPRFDDVYAGARFRKPANFGREHGAHFAEQSRRGRQYPRFVSWGYRDRYDEAMAIYHQLVHGVDHAVGTIREALRESGVADRTVVIFTSDNGFLCGSHGYGSKVLPYEESARVPCIVFDPRRPSRGRGIRSRALTANIDIAPTILDLAGVAAPEGMDGRSLRPLLDDPAATGHEDLAIMNVWGPAPTHYLSVVSEGHKYIYWPYASDGLEATEELYDLDRDPLELSNLATRPDSRPTLDRLRAVHDARVATWRREARTDHGYAAYGSIFDRSIPWKPARKRSRPTSSARRTTRPDPASVPHPFILWTPAEATELRRLHEAEEWRERRLVELSREARGKTFCNLYRYQVLGDEKAGETERRYLLSFIDAPVDSRDASGHRVGLHYDNYAHALRYDVLYDSLTPPQRKALEATFRGFVRHELEHPYHNTRLSLLPNMQLPRRVAAHLMSVTLRDEALIREIWAAPSGFRWYFDEYLSDGGFYQEEFGKMTSLIGELLLYCRGLERLGLDELGYGFRGREGATMRSYVESLLWIGYPRTEIPGGAPRYERVTMGDARQNVLGVFQHSNVQGRLPSGEKDRRIGGWDHFYGANMNGRDHRNRKVGKLHLPQWLEILHARYPRGPFGYFLAQMRERGAEAYAPSPFWGLRPLAPSEVEAPEARSAVWPDRGFAILRAQEGPSYWESPAPAVALQFATLYVHYTADCFSLLGYHAFHRPIYVNRTISDGYNGGPWDFSVLGHCGVIVDAEQAQPIGRVPTRSEFSDSVKFVAARGVLAPGAEPYRGRGEVRSSDQPRDPFTDVYSGVDLSRALFLTREYLLDVYRVADRSGRDRDVHWLVHAPGLARLDQRWEPSTRLQETLLNIRPIPAERQPRARSWERCEDPADSWIRVEGERRLRVDAEPVDLTIVQDCALDDVATSQLGREWYERRIGVRLRLLGEPGTTAYVFDTPTGYRPGTHRAPRAGRPRPRPETGGVSVAVGRRAPETLFVALHEPIEDARSRIDTFQRIAGTSDAAAVAVTGSAAGVNDRVLVRVGERATEPITLAGEGPGGSETFTFAGHAWLRAGADRVDVRGDLRAMRLRVTGRPELRRAGRPVPARFEDGCLVWP